MNKDAPASNAALPWFAGIVLSAFASCMIFAVVFFLCWWLDDSSTRGTRDLLLDCVYPWPRLFSRSAGTAMFILMAAQFAIYAIGAMALGRSGMKRAYVGLLIAGLHLLGIVLWRA